MGFIRVYIFADKAEPKPPLGPILGQLGVNSSNFCKDFNESTAELAMFDEVFGFLLTVDLLVLENRTVKFFIRKPTISVLLKLVNAISIANSNYFFKKRFVMRINDFLKLVIFKYGFVNMKELKRVSFICKGTARALGICLIK